MADIYFYEAEYPFVNGQEVLSTSATQDTVTVQKVIKKANTDSVFIKLERRRQLLEKKRQEAVKRRIIRKVKRDTNKLKEYNPDTIPFFRKGEPPSNFLQNKGGIRNLDYKEDIKKTTEVFVQEQEVIFNNERDIQTATEQQPKPKKQFIHNYSEDWMIGIFILAAILLSWARLFYTKYFDSVFLSFFKFSASNKLFRDSNVIYSRMSFVLNIIFILFFSLFTYQLMIWQKIPFYFDNSIMNFLALCGGFVIIYTTKLVILKMVGNIVQYRSAFDEYIHTIFILNKNIGFYLLIVTLAVAYTPELFTHLVLKCGLGLFAINFIVRIIRSLRIFIPKGVSIFYMILYLCTLEILPVVFLYKAGCILIFRHL